MNDDIIKEISLYGNDILLINIEDENKLIKIRLIGIILIQIKPYTLDYTTHVVTKKSILILYDDGSMFQFNLKENTNCELVPNYIIKLAKYKNHLRIVYSADSLLYFFNNTKNIIEIELNSNNKIKLNYNTGYREICFPENEAHHIYNEIIKFIIKCNSKIGIDCINIKEP